VSPDALRRALLAAALHERPRIAPSRLLVAGDDPDYRAWFRLALARTFRGAIVERVPDSPSALAAIDHAEPSVAILDLDMLGSGGLDLVASIRARPSETRVPVIVTTALRELSDGRSLRTLDIDGFLAKPFEPSQLVTMIRRLLSVPPEATARPRALEAGRSESHA